MSTRTDLVKFFESERKFEPKYGLCSVAFITKDDKLSTYKQMGCHAILRSAPANVGAIYSSLWVNKPEMKEKCYKYWDLLFDPETSPYRKALKKYEILRNEEGEPIAFGILDVDVPTQIGAALFFQTRTSYERPDKIESFSFWLSQGFDPIESLYLSEVLVIHNSALLKNTAWHSAHNWCVDIRKLRAGEPTNVQATATWAKGVTNYTPVSEPWNGGDPEIVYKICRIGNGYVGSFRDFFKRINGGSLNFQGEYFLPPVQAAIKLKEHRGEWSKV